MTTENKAIVLREQSLQPFEAVKQNVEELNKFYKKLMQKGTDYDIIPGTQKPTLLKSGAELLRLRFGFNPRLKIDKGLTDISRGFIEYDITCSLYREDEFIADGAGNANSLESKWRYRWVWPNELPKDFDKDKAYSTYGATRKTKQGGTQYRIENENPQDQANTILKIAKKRAFVDAILTATGASRIFTQDIEEMGGDAIETPLEATGEPTEGIKASPSTNPLVDAAKQAGAIVLPILLDFPKLNKKYGVSLDFCWLHDNADWKSNKFGKLSHKTQDGWCNFSEVIKPVTAELAEAFNWDASMMNEVIKKDYEGRTWSKLTEAEQVEFLEGLITE